MSDRQLVNVFNRDGALIPARAKGLPMGKDLLKYYEQSFYRNASNS